jgi:hypothetical protein
MPPSLGPPRLDEPVASITSKPTLIVRQEPLSRPLGERQMSGHWAKRAWRTPRFPFSTTPTGATRSGFLFPDITTKNRAVPRPAHIRPHHQKDGSQSLFHGRPWPVSRPERQGVYRRHRRGVTSRHPSHPWLPVTAPRSARRLNGAKTAPSRGATRASARRVNCGMNCHSSYGHFLHAHPPPKGEKRKTGEAIHQH